MPRWPTPASTGPTRLVVAAMNPEEFVGDGNFASQVATYLGLADVPALRVETATSSGAAAFYAGLPRSRPASPAGSSSSRARR